MKFEDIKTIGKDLGCEFTRFNLDDPNFGIFQVINNIYCHREKNMMGVYNKLKEHTEININNSVTG